MRNNTCRWPYRKGQWVNKIIESHPPATMNICTKSYSNLIYMVGRYAPALPWQKTTECTNQLRLVKTVTPLQDVNIFQWNKALQRFVCWFWVTTTCSVVKDKPLKGNMNLCPSAWGQLHPYGLLDPPGPTWCEVSWSDASLAACLLSKEAIRVSYSPPGCAACSSIYWMGRERKG